MAHTVLSNSANKNIITILGHNSITNSVTSNNMPDTTKLVVSIHTVLKHSRPGGNLWINFSTSRRWTQPLIHSIVMCRMWRFLAVLRSLFHSSLLCTFILPPFSTNYSSNLSHLILPSISWSTSQFVVLKFIYNTLLRILFSSIFCTCPHQCNLFNLTVSVSGFFNHCINFFIGQYPPIFFFIVIYWA